MREFKTLHAKLEEKSFPEDAEAPGQIIGLASVYNVVDHDNEIVVPGAFAKTIQERPTVKLLWQHDVKQPIGLAELTDTPLGLQFKGRLTLEVEKARECYALMKAGVIDSFSIGYDVVKALKGDGGARKLTELRLHEISPVTFAANELALLQSVKNLDADPVQRALALFVELSRLSEAMKGRTLTEHERRLVEVAVDGLKGWLAPSEQKDDVSTSEQEAAGVDAETGTSEEEAATAHVEPEQLHSLSHLVDSLAAMAAKQR